MRQAIRVKGKGCKAQGVALKPGHLLIKYFNCQFLNIAIMLRLRHISITQFKNYERFSVDFTSNVVGISGKNGMGKTNLLDAIYYSCFTRSYFTHGDASNILNGTDGFRLKALFEKDGKDLEVISVYRGGNKKEISVNGVPYEKLSHHIGVLPVVMIAPDDVELITGGSEGRRKFVDTLISQLNPGYLQELIRYNKVLQQRNSLLKNWNHHSSYELLDALDHQMTAPGDSIFTTRRHYFHELIPLVKKFYQRIAPGSDSIELNYQSQLSGNDQASLLLDGREKDILLQRSNYGIHKDDLTLQLHSQPFKTIASQGQRKSLLFALKLAEYETIRHHKSSCILLLDDVFEKLDEERMKNLMEWVCLENSGQVFITDTHRGRLEEAFNTLGIAAQEVIL